MPHFEGQECLVIGGSPVQSLLIYMETEYTLHYKDFTYHHYRRLLKIAKANYNVVDYPSSLTSQAFCVWRHDVDFSLEYALKFPFPFQD